MRARYLALLLAFWSNFSWADFSNTVAFTHPGWPSTTHYLPGGVPYIIELNGEWPTDCHPGEQKPVISEYAGDSALIEFETIVEHVTCNDVVTPFRILVDMSDVFGDFEDAFGEIEITVRYGGSDFVETLLLSCPLCSPPPLPGPPTNPEAGLYYSNGLEKQGLLLARQNQRMGVFPLIYDESGSSEWLIGAGGITEDVFFAELLESTGGQCLGCLPPDGPPQMGVVGKISMLMDSEGVVQVKIDNGLFETYEPLAFGYGEIDIGGFPQIDISDLSGRWAFVEGVVEDPRLPPSGSNSPLIPLVFDIALISTHAVPRPIVTVYPPFPPGYVLFSVRDNEGSEVAQMKCSDLSDWGDHEAGMVCDLKNADINGGDPIYEVRMLSIERLRFDLAVPGSSEVHSSAPIAVRID